MEPDCIPYEGGDHSFHAGLLAHILCLDLTWHISNDLVIPYEGGDHSFHAGLLAHLLCLDMTWDISNDLVTVFNLAHSCGIVWKGEERGETDVWWCWSYGLWILWMQMKTDAAHCQGVLCIHTFGQWPYCSSVTRLEIQKQSIDVQNRRMQIGCYPFHWDQAAPILM